MVSWRSCHGWICSPSRRTKTTGIHVFTGRFNHMFVGMVISATRKLNFCFKPVEQKCYCKYKKYTFKYWLLPLINSLNSCNKSRQKQQTTPNKLNYFLRSIQSTLQFMNSSNLHDNQQFCLIKYRVTQILLKIHKLTGAIPCFSQYSSHNNNTIEIQL